MNFNSFMLDTKRSLYKHSPEICTAAGILSMLIGTVLAVKTTKSALKHIEEADISKNDSKKDKVIKTVKATWKDYAPAAACEIGGVLLLTRSNRQYAHRNKDLVNALYISETAYRNLQEKMDEKLTKKEVDEIRDSIEEDKAKKNYKEYRTEWITGDGNHLFCDNVTGQFFRSTYEEVHNAKETIRENTNATGYSKVGELLDMFGEHPCELGERYWISGSEIVDNWRETTFTLNGEEATAISYYWGHGQDERL